MRGGGVVDKLSQVCKHIHGEVAGFAGSHDILAALAALAVRGGAVGGAAVRAEGVLELLGDAFRVDVRVPDHRGGDERIRDLARFQREPRIRGVSQVELSHEDAAAEVDLGDVAARRGGAALAEGGCGGAVAEGDVGGARVVGGLQAEAEEPVIRERDIRADPQAVAELVGIRAVGWIS